MTTDPGTTQESDELRRKRTEAVAALVNLRDFGENGKRNLTPEQVDDLKALISLDVGLVLEFMRAEAKTHITTGDDAGRAEHVV